MHIEIIVQLFLAFGLGALVGIERGIYENETEVQKKSYDSFGGVRSFGLIAVLGALLGIFAQMFQSSSIIIVGVCIISIFLVIFYILSGLKTLKYSLTTEISAILTFFLGVLISIGYYQVSIIVSILLTLLMSSEGYIDSFIDKISRQEFNNSIKFLVIALVVLPLLPNNLYSISDLVYAIGYEGEIVNNILNLKFFNPYSLWMFVVLMSGISYVGYILSKFVGEKSSILASGAIGGLASSTALTASMSELSKKDLKNTDMYVVATLIASIMMFLRVIVIVLIFNINLLGSILLPSIAMLIGLVVYIIYFYIRSKKNNENVTVKEGSKKIQSPFRITPALKFATIVLITKFIAGLGTIYSDIWGDKFFYALGIISGGADADALAQTMSVSSGDGMIPLSVAAVAIILGVMSNNMVKGFMAMKFGGKKYGIAVMIGFLVSMIIGIFGIIFLNLTN